MLQGLPGPFQEVLGDLEEASLKMYSRLDDISLYFLQRG
jgi:hypothetical protein